MNVDPTQPQKPESEMTQAEKDIQKILDQASFPSDQKEEVKSFDPDIQGERGTEQWAKQITQKMEKEADEGVEVEQLALPEFEHVQQKLSELQK